MFKFHIRPIQERDCIFIAELCFQLGYPTSADEVKPRICDILSRDNHKVFVAEEDDGKVVGWVHVHLYPLLESELMAEIGGLVVNRDFRKNGIGGELMLNAEHWAKSKGCSTVSLRSNAVRQEAHAFYQSIGYAKVKEQYTFRKTL